MKETRQNPEYKKLSIVIPVFNEERTLEKLVDKVLSISLPLLREVVIVDDCSSDGTAEILERLKLRSEEIRVFRNERNMGKGYSVRCGITAASGDLIIIQDADLEYNPEEYPKLLGPLLEQHADVVYGSRFITTEARRVLYYWHSVGNHFLTMFSNMLSNLNLSDMETCYKVFRSDIIKTIRLTENRFGFEPEVTFKLSRIPGIRFYEVGISYHGRSYAEGKKINWKDGVRAFYVLFKNMFGYFFRGRRMIYIKSAPKG